MVQLLICLLPFPSFPLLLSFLFLFSPFKWHDSHTCLSTFSAPSAFLLRVLEERLMGVIQSIGGPGPGVDTYLSEAFRGLFFHCLSVHCNTACISSSGSEQNAVVRPNIQLTACLFWISFFFPCSQPSSVISHPLPFLYVFILPCLKRLVVVNERPKISPVAHQTWSIVILSCLVVLNVY